MDDDDLRARAKRAVERSLRLHGVEIERSAPDAAEIARIEDALRRLPRFQRAIFLAVRIDNLSYDEIARQTGLSRAGVEKHFARAIGNLFNNVQDSRRHWWRRWL